MNRIQFFTFSIFLLFISETPLLAQHNFGIKTGMNLSDIQVHSEKLLVEQEYEYVPLRLWHFGVVGVFDISKRFAIQPELLFTQKGAQNALRLITLPEQHWKYKMSYLSLPVMLQYKLGPISIEAGPEFGYILKNSVILDGEEVKDLLPALDIFADKKFDLSANLGFKFTAKHFFTQVRWQRSILSIADISFSDANGDLIGYYNHYHSALQVSFGYLIK